MHSRKRGHKTSEATKPRYLILLGSVADKAGDKNQAIAYLERRRPVRSQSSVLPDGSRRDVRTGETLSRRWRPGYSRSACHSGRDGQPAVGDRYYVPRNLTILADLKAHRGRYAEAKALYDQAEDVIEGMLISVDEPYWNSSVVAAQSQTYLQHFELVARGGDVPEAFRVLERVRGRTLAWALEDRKAFPTSESTDGILGNRCGWAPNSIDAERATPPNASNCWTNWLSTSVVSAWRGQREMKRTTTARAASQLLKIVQDDLKQDEVLLEYVLDDPNSYCVSISRQGAFVRVLPTGRKEIEKLAQEYIDEIRARRRERDIETTLRTAIETDSRNIESCTELLIAPDGILNLLPFEALQDETGPIPSQIATLSATCPQARFWICFAASRCQNPRQSHSWRLEMSPMRTRAAQANGLPSANICARADRTWHCGPVRRRTK